MEATMRAVPVVVVKPGKKVFMALLRVLVQAGVSPFVQGGLNKTFGFAVGARSIRTSEVVAQIKFNHSGVKSVGTVTMTVVGE